MAMPSTLSLVMKPIIASVKILKSRRAQVVAVTMLALTIISIATAPDTRAGIWSWIGLLAVGAFATLAVLAYAASQHSLTTPADRQYRLIGAIVAGVVALVLNLAFAFPSTLLLAVGLVIVGREASHAHERNVTWAMCATIVMLVPWWIWSALDAWKPGLLLLVPLAALAWVSDGHIREAYRARKDDERPHLSMRSHRLGAWMGILLGGILVVLVGLVGNATNAWIALGGVLMAVAVALEAGVSQPENRPGKYSAVICDGAFLALAICWLISLS